MATNKCPSCGRAFSSERKACPGCGAVVVGGSATAESGRRLYALLAVTVVVAAVGLQVALSRETGPSPELEALHSQEDAIAACLESVQTTYAERRGRVIGLPEAEYLQGGEYVVRAEMTLMTDGRMTNAGFRCEAQFRSEVGLRIEYIEIEP